MVLINLWWENIQFITDTKTISLEREAIESDFTKILLHIYQEKHFDAIYVLQGPGSFTTIRLGILLLNTFAMLVDHTVSFYTLSKEELYLNLYKQKPWCPEQSILFIGQRKNARLFDNKTWDYEILSRKILAERPWSYMTDILEFSDLDSRFIFNHLDISLLTQLPRKSVTMFEPYYAIEPNID